MNLNKAYKIDTYDVKQYENKRIVDVVKILEIKNKYCLCYSPLLRANILVKKSDLMGVK